MLSQAHGRNSRTPRLALLPVLAFAAAAAAWLITCLQTLNLPLPQRVLWEGYGGARVSGPGGAHLTTYLFGDASGKKLFTSFSFGRGCVAWWSNQDGEIGLLRLSGQPTWIKVPGKLVDDWTISRMGVSPSAVYLNVFRWKQEAGHPGEGLVREDGVIRVGFRVGEACFLPGAMSVRCDPASERLDIQRSERDIDVTENGRTVRSIHSARKIWSWDMSRSGDVIGILDDGGVIAVVTPTKMSRWKVPLRWRGSRLSMADAPRHLWLTNDLPFSLGSYLDAFSLDGNHIGSMVRSSDPFFLPILTPNSEMLSLLKRSDERVTQRER